MYKNIKLIVFRAKTFFISNSDHFHRNFIYLIWEIGLAKRKKISSFESFWHFLHENKPQLNCFVSEPSDIFWRVFVERRCFSSSPPHLDRPKKTCDSTTWKFLRPTRAPTILSLISLCRPISLLVRFSSTFSKLELSPRNKNPFVVVQKIFVLVSAYERSEKPHPHKLLACKKTMV